MPVRDRQHRESGLGEIFGAIERERPEMRRGPRENDEEQKQRLEGNFAVDGGPAEHRRHRSGGSADHDVLRRHGLEQDRVDHGVADESAEGKPHGERIDEGVQHPQPGAADCAGERKRLKRRELPTGQGPRPSARHDRVDLLLYQAIHRRRRARNKPDADGRGEEKLRRHHARNGEEHADDRAEHDQRHYARLGEAQELAHAEAGDGRSELHEEILSRSPCGSNRRAMP